MKKTRVLQVGCGSITGGWFEIGTARNDVEYVGLCDLSAAAAQGRKNEFALDCPVFTDAETALKATRPDVVFDCTIPAAHAPTAILAFENGAHVLTEKPLADSMDNARRALDAARQHDRKYVVTQNYRYQRGPRRLKALLESGVLGKVTAIKADMYVAPHFGGFRDQMRHVLLLDMSIHTFDMARFLSGVNAQWVFCHEWNPLGSWFAHDACAAAIFGMSNDIVFTLNASWCATGLPTSFGSAWRITGERGTALWDDQGLRAEVESGDEGFFRPVEAVEVPEGDFGRKEENRAGIMHEFLDSLNGGPDAETSAFDNIHSLAMVEGAVQSAEQGAKVEVKSVTPERV